MSVTGPLRVCSVQIDGFPQALTRNGRLWVPSEPLVANGALDDSDVDLSAARFFSAEAGAGARAILEKIQEIGSNETLELLPQVLTQITQHEAHIIVFPEYLLPLRALEVLTGFSQGAAIVAGLGIIRNRDDAEFLLARSSTELSVDQVLLRNVTVLVENEVVHVITKMHLSENEVATPGDGPRTFELVLRGRRVRLAVAVCLDFLRLESTFLHEAPDVVCIPALSRTVEPFLPDEPRDYVRVLANGSMYGGSTIVAPSLRGPVFTDRMGVRPLPRWTAGIVMIEHDRWEQKPASLVRTENRLVLRAQIIRKRNNDVAVSAAGLLAQLKDTGAKSDSSELVEKLSRWIDSLSAGQPLRESLEEYRRALAQEIEDPELYGILSTHSVVTASTDFAAVRAAQAKFVVTRIGELVASGATHTQPGRLLDRYSAVAASHPEETAPVQDPSSDRWSFSLRLGAYDRRSAASTLPRQLNFLRALAEAAQGSVSITYRIHSAVNPQSADLQPFFDVMVEGDAKTFDARQVEAQVRSMFVESWPISRPPEVPAIDDAAHVLRIIPEHAGRVPAVREDWASVMDLLRTHPTPISIDMKVSPAPASPTGPENDDERGMDASLMDAINSMPYVTVGDEADKRAAAYFGLLRDAAKAESRSLGLAIALWSAEPIPSLLAANVKHELFGSAQATVKQGRADEALASTAVYRPSELLRIFHPPFGRMQGRGLPAASARRIPFNGRVLPSVGARIGRATIASPRADREAEVVLDESGRTRHVYVVGRTGTGKTNFLKELCRQDIESGRGIAVLDPHGDLVDYLAGHCQKRMDETVLLDFGQQNHIPLFNPLQVDISDQRSQALQLTEFLRVLESRYYNQFTGPVFDDMLRQAVETMFDPHFPAARSLDLVEAMYRNREARRLIAESLSTGSLLRDRWNTFEAISDKEKAERVTWMLSKFADLMPVGSPLRLAMCSTIKSPLSIDEIVWNDGILLVKIPEAAIGSEGAAFLGSLFVRKIQRALYDYQRATGVEPRERQTFTLCIDEFQKFANAGIEGLVAEARKFGCGLVLAHQNLEQLYAFSRFEGSRSRELLNAILGNVGTAVAFKAGADDAVELSRILKTDASAFDDLPKYNALCRLTVDAEDTPCFTLAVDDADRKPGVPSVADRLRTTMVETRYWGANDDVSAEIELHLAGFERSLESYRDGAAMRESTARAATFAELSTTKGDELLESLAELVDESVESEVLNGIISSIVLHHVDLRSAILAEVVSMVAEVASGHEEDLDGTIRRVAASVEKAGVAERGRLALLAGLRRYLERTVTVSPETTVEDMQEGVVLAVTSGFVASREAEEGVSFAVLKALRDSTDVTTSDLQEWASYLDAGSAALACLRVAASQAAPDLRARGPVAGSHRHIAPSDISDSGNSTASAEYLDLGGLLCRLREGVSLQLAYCGDGSRVHELRFLDAGGGSASVQLFAAPDGPFWPTKLQDLKAKAPRGTVLRSGIAVEFIVPVAEDERRLSRTIGFDGPGWMVLVRYEDGAGPEGGASLRLVECIGDLIVRHLEGYQQGNHVHLRKPNGGTIGPDASDEVA